MEHDLDREALISAMVSEVAAGDEAGTVWPLAVAVLGRRRAAQLWLRSWSYGDPDRFVAAFGREVRRG